ncbi:hypothetical protein EXW93_12125 [Exiguobacterium sp. JMULE1]|uniref:hypothetical protein n=1 Tax=Exiguobacterium sp. JMULE1 TaxID=2518339 RepID=UPI001576C93C|nr:hypothetical protein [Exiguobacterium sp. JMULE1]NTY10345.1 hypothetical protein [Exiguobacterium sp. JMULE1]
MSAHGKGSQNSNDKGKPKQDVFLGREFTAYIRKIQEDLSKDSEETKDEQESSDVVLGVTDESHKKGDDESPISKKTEDESSPSSTKKQAKRPNTPTDAVRNSLEFIESVSTSSLDVYRPSEELDKLAKDLDGHLSQFLIEALKEYKDKGAAREQWSNRIWKFTKYLVIGTFVLLFINYLLVNLKTDWKTPLVTEKLLYVFVGGMFAQVIALMIIVMKYVFSPSKDVYSYLTELVKARKLKNGYEDNQENNGNNSNN